jgi:hypothetical protein
MTVLAEFLAAQDRLLALGLMKGGVIKADIELIIATLAEYRMMAKRLERELHDAIKIIERKAK